MRIFIPAAAAAAAAAAVAIPAAPALAAQCGCAKRVVHRTSYAPVRHHAVRRVAYVRPVVRRVVYRPRIVEVVRPVVYRPVVYRPVRPIYVEPMWRPRPAFYGARYVPGPRYGFRHHRFRHDGYRYGGGWHRGGYGWR